MFWGIDLGGTKIEGVVLAARRADAVVARHRIDTEGAGGYEHILHRIRLLVETLSKECGAYPQQIGIGTPGTIEPQTGLLKNSNTLCLNGNPVRQDLEELLQIPIRIANDANCFALAEYHLGSIATHFPDAGIAFGVIMGTGVGGGVVIHGEVLGGHHGIGGEWGHMYLSDEGEDCYCGRHGCVETIISGPALERFYTSLSGKQLKLKHILESNDDPNAEKVRQRLIHFFAKGIGQVINVIDPDVIVLGGGLSNTSLLYTEGKQQIAKHIFNPVCTTPILQAQLGDSAGVFGAALLLEK